MSTNVNHFTKYGAVLKKLLQEEKYADATLIVSGREFPVLRPLLAAQSPFFDRLFYDNPFSEGPDKRINVEAPPDAFALILQYLYTGQMELQHQDMDDLFEILELSHRYDLPALEKSLTTRMVELTNSNNLSFVIRAANLFNSEQLKAKCVDLINVSQLKFFNEDECIKLPQGEFLEIFSFNKLNLLMIEKFRAIDTWIKGNPDCDKTKLLDLIDLSKLSNAQIKEIVGPTNLYEKTFLMELIWKRKADVAEEVNIDKSVLLPEKGAKVVIGSNPAVSNVLFTSEYIYATPFNNVNEIIVDFGDICDVNLLKFSFGGMQKYYNYTLSFSFITTFSMNEMNVDSNWAHLRSFKSCRGEQTVYFETVKMRLLRIQGPEKCKKIEAFRTRDFPEMVGHHLIPRGNVFTPKNAIIMGNWSNEILCSNAITWDMKENGYQTTFTEGVTINFCLNQPHFLTKIRFRLWDYDGRKQNLILSSCDSENIWEWLKTPDFMSGWFTFNLKPKAYSGFYFQQKPHHTMPNRGHAMPVPHNILRIVHFEGSACLK